MKTAFYEIPNAFEILNMDAVYVEMIHCSASTPNRSLTGIS